MRRFFSIVAVTAGLLLVGTGVQGQTAPAAASAPGKIGFINSQKVIAQAPGAKEAQQTFEKEMQGFQAQLKPAADSIQKLIEEYQQQSVTLSPAVKKQREDAIRARQEAFQQKENQLEQQAARRQQELVQPVMERVRAVLDELRKEGGYAVIFDVAGGGGIVSADPALDLTDQVLARLQKLASTGAAPAKKP